MASKVWLLVEWLDESNAMSSYCVVSVTTQAYNTTGLQLGQITLIRVNRQNAPRRAKILWISDNKREVDEQKLKLEREDQQIQRILGIFEQSMQNDLKKSVDKQQTSGHSSTPKVSNVRTNNNDSSSDSEANVEIDGSKTGNFSKSTSKSTPQSKHQQSTSKQRRSTLNANNSSHRSIISSIPLPSTSARTDIPYTPQNKHQQSTSKQIRGTSITSDNRSIINCTPLPSTSARTDIPYTPQNKHQQSTSKQIRGMSTTNDNGSIINCTPLPSTSARTDIPYTPKNKHQQSTSKQTRDRLNVNKNQGSQTKDKYLVRLSDIENFEEGVRCLHKLFSDLVYRKLKFKMSLCESTSTSETVKKDEASCIEQNVGEQNVGEQIVGEQNVDEQNVDEQNVGEQNVGEQNVCEQNVGEQNVGEQNVDEQNVGEQNVVERNIGEQVGEQNVGEQNVGEQNVGEQNVGEQNVGEQNVGEQIVGEQNVDEQNVDEQNIGELNIGEQNVGEQNVGEQIVGEQNVIENVGEIELNYFDNENLSEIELNYFDNENLGEIELNYFDNENVGEIELNYFDNEEVGAEELIENNGGEQQADMDQSFIVNAEQESNPNTWRVRRMSAQTTNNIENNIMVPIGFGHAEVPESVMIDIDWSAYTFATRILLQAVFPRSVLATHSLTGKPSLARLNKPARQMLDPLLVADIIMTVMENCAVPRNLVRTCISRICAEEAKLYHKQLKPKKTRKAEDENDDNQENISPSTTSSDE